MSQPDTPEEITEDSVFRRILQRNNRTPDLKNRQHTFPTSKELAEDFEVDHTVDIVRILNRLQSKGYIIFDFQQGGYRVIT